MSQTHKAEAGTGASAPRAVLRPRDAATLIIVDRSSPAPRILMGRRRPEQVFLPNTFVFPGGRVEATDRVLARRHALPETEAECVKAAMRGRPSATRAAALALAAIRETFEETGFIVGRPQNDSKPANAGGWSAFHAEGFEPHLSGLTFLARAITPPGRPRRYDTRFFVVDAREVAHRASSIDGELLDIDWFTIDAARTLKLPSITQYILEDIAAFLVRPADAAPFYFHRRGRFERALLPRTIVRLDSEGANSMVPNPNSRRT
ncbi:NUDIX domain-containing protein [Hyphomicrobium sp. CS1GBMeth3]|uniref:NUDIX hydrolase n=1 Tax=Hyphomicrobium sp. CS1GBMeth3 TaxID=1892845 RepID=UPI000AB6E905|nr:NUDIX domain-containing protein [Hyphomicrobium sp. CS1GBMeth3]